VSPDSRKRSGPVERVRFTNGALVGEVGQGRLPVVRALFREGEFAAFGLREAGIFHWTPEDRQPERYFKMASSMCGSVTIAAARLREIACSRNLHLMSGRTTCIKIMPKQWIFEVSIIASLPLHQGGILKTRP
jgi:hypothetical protein